MVIDSKLRWWFMEVIIIDSGGMPTMAIKRGNGPWGYALSQLPGGWLSKIFGGRVILQFSVLVWSLATAIVPLVAGFMPGLVLSRILVGIEEGVSPSAATDLIARVSKELYAPALGGIMLSIGIKLSIEDFTLAFKRPLPLSMGFVTQYELKPALGVLLARSFGVAPMFYPGFLLMSCVSGAQLSSYASFLSKGDVALSILLTSSSTIASVIVTPLLTGLIIGSVVPVDAVTMSKSILQWLRSFNQRLRESIVLCYLLEDNRLWVHVSTS